MGRFVSRIIVVLFVFGAASGMLWAQSTNAIQVQMAANGVNYLTDSKGMTLYYYTLDTTGQSACYGGCAKAWPVFYSPSISVASSLDASDFGAITRTDGSMQTTYKGWPLYYWFKDAKPGDMTGEGVQKVWYVLKVPPYSVMIGTNKAVGNYLVDSLGRSLYYYTKDSPGMSACTGGCLKAWPAFTADSLVIPSALQATDFSTITRDDGTKQVTYKGYPLYYWVKDLKRGDVTGQDVGKVWYVIDPDKFNPGKM
jgi:predicted lipoprotein with Yx(FWY)xxD motif